MTKKRNQNRPSQREFN